MGMFDRIWFKCPQCGKSLETQSKAGECHLIDYDSDNVPESIARSLDGESIYCPECDRSYEIEGEREKIVSCRLRA